MGSADCHTVQRTPLATTLPARRIEIRFGGFDLPDFFGLNSSGSDSHKLGAAALFLCAVLACSPGARAQITPNVSVSQMASQTSDNSLSALQSATALQNGDSPQNPPATPQATQSPTPDNSAPAAPDESPVTMFPHSDTARWWISGQGNIVFQWYPSFPAAYSGAHSFGPQAEDATSRVYTLYTGYELTHSTEVFADIESAGGLGLSDAFGLAGFTNLDVVRNPSLGSAPYLARLMIRQIISLSDEKVSVQRTPLALATSLPARRIEIRAGKFGMVDFFDLNSGGSDSHLQFLNWTVDNNGAYDYAANTRGYTDGVILEYDDHNFSARFAEALMPKVANGIQLDADVARARAENLEFDYTGNFLPDRTGTIRFLSYANHADMGDYREAINNFLNSGGQQQVPDITTTRQQGRVKYGFGVSAEQQLWPHLQFFGRWGWNEGRHESFAYTEVNQALELGAAFTDIPRRKNDHAGFAFSQNAISGDHRRYLALGGLGFLLGDGGLDYAREEITEGYYTLHVWRGAFATFDLQRIWNPGYNQARGPVIVPTLRAHVDF
jgi:high affinity Mn2+ porin